MPRPENTTRGVYYSAFKNADNSLNEYELHSSEVTNPLLVSFPKNSSATVDVDSMSDTVGISDWPISQDSDLSVQEYDYTTNIPESVVGGKRESVASGRRESLTSGRLESLTSGRRESLTSGRRESLTSGRRESLASGRRDSCTNRPLPVPPSDVNGEVHRSGSPLINERYANCNGGMPSKSKTSLAKDNYLGISHHRRLVIGLIFSLILSAAASVFSVYTYITADVNRKGYCLDCSLLTLTPEHKPFALDYQVTTKQVNGQEMCCIDSSEGLSLMVVKTQQNERKNFAANQNLTTAHVGLYANKGDASAKIRELSHYTLFISNKSSLVHLQNVIKGPKSLSIVTTGRYFIYSSIHFSIKHYKDSCNSLAHTTWVHHVLLYRKNAETSPLLRAEHTCCVDCQKYATNTFTGGIFELHTGDNIMVDVSAPPLVVDDNQSSYLGLFLVDDNLQ